MKSLQRLGRRAVLPIVVLLLLLLAGLMNWLNQKQAAVSPQAQLQEAVTADVKKLGGKLSHGLSAPARFLEAAPLPSVDAADLSNTAADGALLKELCQLATIQRLNLEGTKIQPGQFADLESLSNLQTLSLARTQITDSDMAALAKLSKLATLSLRETAIGDSGIKHLTGMPALLNLDVSRTRLTADGLKTLAALPALRTITLDENCITSDSVQQLKSLKGLQSIEVRIASGLGKQAKQLLAGQFSGTVVGTNPRGQQVWDAANPWDTTVAGVLEAADAEIGLTPQEMARLVEILDGTGFGRPQAVSRFNSPVAEPIGDEIKSFDEFLAALSAATKRTVNIRDYARTKVTKADVPKLLEVLKAQENLKEPWALHLYGSFLLVRHGDDDPEVIRELERLLTHQDPFVRSRTLDAFSPSGGGTFPRDLAWPASDKMIELGVFHAIRLCDDEIPMVRMSAADELGNLVMRAPKYATQAMSALIQGIRRGGIGYGSRAISQIAAVNAEAAKAAVPELRRMLEHVETELPTEYVNPTNWEHRSAPMSREQAEASYRLSVLTALCSAAGVDPNLANEVAKDYLDTLSKHSVYGAPVNLLVAPNNHDATRTLIRGLIELADTDDHRRLNVAKTTLAAVLSEVRDFPPEFTVQLDVVKQELDPKFCWFHPRVAAVPAMGKDGKPLIVLTIQKHLAADDHYSGLHYMTSGDLGGSWSELKAPQELDWKPGENQETIAVCDVTPGWHAPTKKVIAIGTMLRYSQAGAQLLDKPRSYEFAYAVYDPQADSWTSWKVFDMPMGNDNRFHQVAPGCVQWLVKSDGTLLVPIYYQGPKDGPYSATVVHAEFDGTTLKFLAHGDELRLDEVRGLVEPSLAFFQGNFYLTLRNDNRAYVTKSNDGLSFAPIQPWTFDDGTELGSYNTQQHWVVHRDGLFLAYTRRGASNDHIPRNRAPLFIARVSTEPLHVIRKTEQVLIPERGVMLGNFGAAAIDEHESWVTDSEFISGGKADPRGANGSTFAARIKWSKPSRPSF